MLSSHSNVVTYILSCAVRKWHHTPCRYRYRSLCTVLSDQAVFIHNDVKHYLDAVDRPRTQSGLLDLSGSIWQNMRWTRGFRDSPLQMPVS